MWAGLPEYPFVRHTLGRGFEARRRDTVVALEAAATMDARRAVDGIHAGLLLGAVPQEAAAVAAVARATDLARQLRDAATPLLDTGVLAPVPRPEEGRRALEGHVAAVRAAEAAWAEARIRARRAAARVVAGHVEDGTMAVELKGVRRGRKKKSPLTQGG